MFTPAVGQVFSIRDYQSEDVSMPWWELSGL